MKKIMMIGGGVVLGLLILVIGFVFYVFYLLNTPPKSDPEIVAYTEEKVKDYLIEEKGYSESDILSVNSKRKPKDKDKTAIGYQVLVVFSDEPDTIYYYEIVDEDENKIEQLGITGTDIKHKNFP
ncbi:EGFR-like transmembrane domain-containing protein [Paenibacillus sp. An7]|uniref:EGFR-like transmembrane domain-containing protein n=1 Tax=Paenibacillus sp. An7 TaxID=2689577 RepID=UPI00135A1AB4|nr:transmembrane domain-containing protein [Paenibacillus sp. An7]